MGVQVGYARVSTSDQKLDLQLDALRAAGCTRTFSDVASGARTERHGLADAVDYLREGDTLVVWRLDRLGRSLGHLIETVNALQQRGVQFRSLQENIDTGTPTGQLIFHIFGALAEFERELIRERVRAGLTAARARGRKGGRPRRLSPKQAEQAQRLYDDKRNSIADICKLLGNISHKTLYRYITVAH